MNCMYSDRTAKYVDALVQRRSKFDYHAWLRDVRGDEASSATPDRQKLYFRSREVPGKEALKPDAPIEHRLMLADQHRGPSRQPASSRSSDDRISQRRSGTASIERRLLDIRSAFDQWQQTRNRGAVYGYLTAIVALVQRHERHGRVRRLVIRAQGWAGISPSMAADPFSAILGATCRGRLDSKTISKFARALRYASRYHAEKPVAAFIKQKGGINRCASLYAKRLGRKRH